MEIFLQNMLHAVEVRKALHCRLGLPLDRPLLRIANALNLSKSSSKESNKSLQKGNASSLNFVNHFVDMPCQCSFLFSKWLPLDKMCSANC